MHSPSRKESQNIIARNRRAFFNYEILDTYECGIVLQGTEVKSIKAGKFNFADSYARILNNELWLCALHISPYKEGNIFNHPPVRERKLLVHRSEIKGLHRKTEEKGLTLIPINFIQKSGIVKLELALCRGKKLHDKRASIKERDLHRYAEQELSKSARMHDRGTSRN